MTELEKLAEEALRERFNQIYPKATTGIEMGMREQHFVSAKMLWMEGFLACRELAAKIAERWDCRCWRDVVKPDEMIRQLGESEVRE